MPLVFQVAAILLTAVAMCTALAHTLELPGKMRLSKEAYITVQPIYYPGFTIAGIAEPLAIIVTFVLLLLLPPGSSPFRWTLAGFAALVAMHGAYWIITHPVNKFWLKNQALEGLGGTFFAVGPSDSGGEGQGGEDRWLRSRDRWEYSHVLRAILAAVALVTLVIAVVR